MSEHPNRGTIFLEEAEVLSHQAHPGDQYLLRIQAPECAAAALPGSFLHLRCDPQLPMRRPISILGVDPKAGWVDLLYKAVGEGTRRLAMRQVGEYLSTLGPIGRPFEAHPERPRTLLIGGAQMCGFARFFFVRSDLRPAG